MKQLLKLFLVGLLFCAHAAWSYSTYFCEKRYRSVSVGDSIDSVRAACGEPTTVTTKNIQENTLVNTVQWTYTLGLLNIKGIIFNLPTLTITFRDQVVSKISKSGLLISNNGYCALEGVVNIGDSMQKVIATCGQPNLINNAQQAVTTNTTITVWTYNNGPYKPQVLFEFDRGQLMQIYSGPLGK